MEIYKDNPKYISALEYLDMGFSIIPCNEKKLPLIPWKPFQERRATIEEVNQWFKKFGSPNIGIVTGKLSNLSVIDADSEGGIEEVESHLSDSIEYIIASTPNSGKHFYFCFIEGLTTKTNAFDKVDVRTEGGFVVAPPSINGNGKGWEWLGSKIQKEKLVQVPENLFNALIKRNAKRTSFGLSLNTVSNSTIVSNSTLTLLERGVETTSKIESTDYYKHYKILQQGTRDDDLFYIANSLSRGGRGDDYTRQVLRILAQNSIPPFPLHEVETKIQSAIDRIKRREGSLAEEIKEWCLATDGYFSVTDVLQSLHLTTKTDKKNLTVILTRLCSSGIIEKYGNKRGTYRLRESNPKVMDLTSDDEVEEVRVKLPVGLDRLCILSPGNIAVIAGSKSAGKTAMMMNIANFNQHDFNVIYLNSEMGSTEFKKRMKRFAPLADWNIKGIACHTNFEDYIESDPKNLYIVDFLEVHDNFYEIGKPIRKIHEKLGESLCFIAIQMKAGAVLGRGGDFSAEKARLYLTMDYVPLEKKTKLTIYDAKEPRPPHDSVRGYSQLIKITNGSDLSYTPNKEWS